MSSAPDSEQAFTFGSFSLLGIHLWPRLLLLLVASWSSGEGACLPFFPFSFSFGVLVTPGMMERGLGGAFPSGCSSFSFGVALPSALAVAGNGSRVLRAHPFFGTVDWCLFEALLFPSYATRCRYAVPGVLASGSGLAASA